MFGLSACPLLLAFLLLVYNLKTYIFKTGPKLSTVIEKLRQQNVFSEPDSIEVIELIDNAVKSNQKANTGMAKRTKAAIRLISVAAIANTVLLALIIWR